MDYAQPMSFNSSVDMFSRVCSLGGVTYNSVYIYIKKLWWCWCIATSLLSLEEEHIYSYSIACKRTQLLRN